MVATNAYLRPAMQSNQIIVLIVRICFRHIPHIWKLNIGGWRALHLSNPGIAAAET